MLRGAVVVLVVLAVAGVATASTAKVPKKLVGTYEAYLGSGPGARDPGRWELAIGPRGGVHIVAPLGDIIGRGKAAITDTTIVFPGEGRNAACRATGTYRYLVSGDRLTLYRVRDACRARAFRLATKTWKRFSDYFPVVIVRK